MFQFRPGLAFLLLFPALLQVTPFDNTSRPKSIHSASIAFLDIAPGNIAVNLSPNFQDCKSLSCYVNSCAPPN